MNTALLIVGGFFTAICLGSAAGKLTRNPQVTAGLTHVGVKDAHIPYLAVLEILGGAGLIVGIWSKPLGLAAAFGLALYFAGAVVAHVRVKDSLKDMAPPLVLFLIGLVVLWLEFKR